MYKKIQHWQFIPMEKRMELRKKYGVKPSNPIEIANNKIVLDGISEGDLSPIPMEALEQASGLKITSLDSKELTKEDVVPEKVIKIEEVKAESTLDKSLDVILNETNETPKS